MKTFKFLKIFIYIIAGFLITNCVYRLTFGPPRNVIIDLNNNYYFYNYELGYQQILKTNDISTSQSITHTSDNPVRAIITGNVNIIKISNNIVIGYASPLTGNRRQRLEQYIIDKPWENSSQALLSENQEGYFILNTTKHTITKSISTTQLTNKLQELNISLPNADQ